MSRYSVLIDLNTTGVDELNKIERQILQLQAQGNKPINLKIDVDGNIKNISSMFDSIEKQAIQSGKNISKALQKGMKGFTFNSKDPYFDKFFKQLEVDEKNIDKLSREYNVNPKDARKAYDSYNREIENGLNRRKKQKEANDKSVEKMEQAREQSILNRKKREERLVQAQNDAINKSLENDYKNQVKNREKQINSASKHLESLKKDLSKAISQNDYVDSDSIKKANDLMQMISSTDLEAYNKPLQRVEELTNRVNSAIEKLSQSHKNALGKLNKEIAAEEEANGRALVDAWKQADEYNQREQQYVQEQKKLLSEGKKQEEAYYKSVDEIQKRANSGEFELRNAKMDAFEAKYDGYSGNGQETFSRAKIEIEQIKLLQRELQTGIYESGDKKGLKIVDDDQILKLGQLDNTIDKLGNTMQQFKIESANALDPLSASKLSNNIGKYIKENTRLTKGWVEAFETLQTKAKNGENVSKEFSQLKSKADLEGVSGKSFFSEIGRGFKQIGQFAYTYGALERSFDLIINSINQLKEVDTLLTEISKANDSLSQSDLKNIGKSSFDIAGNYGKTATDFLSGVQEMSRAGYQDALAMAKLSTAAQGAGDMTAEVANQYLIATDKAYKYQGSVESLTKVLDGSNNITNKNAVNMTELANGMSIVGSQAASLGIDANETIAALGTMIASTQQSGSEMARAFRAILLNLQQVTDEEEGIDAEGLNKYEQACNDLNVSLKETKNGITSLRDPMEVLKDLSVQYRKLAPNDIRRTNLLSSVGGKLRANALNALLEGWDTYEKMLGEYESGGGSMAREAEKTAQSWEGSLNRMKNSWTSFISNFAQSETMISGINFLNDIIQGIDHITQSFGTLSTVMTTLGVFQGIANGGESTQKSLCIF